MTELDYFAVFVRVNTDINLYPFTTTRQI